MTLEQWLTYVYIMLGFDTIVFSIVIYIEFWRKRGRIKVRIKTPLKERVKWVKPEPDGKTLVLEKGNDRKKIPEWKATFSNKSLIPISRWLFRRAFAVDIFHDAKKCIEYNYSFSSANQPKWTKKQSKEFIEAEVLRQRGRGLKYQMPTLFWFILIAVIINLAISFIIAQRMNLF